jgi:hypothetical protein
MENQENAIVSLVESARDYLETTADLLKLKAVDKSADITSSVVSGLVILVITIFGILLLNLGISFWLGNLLGEVWYGFFALGSFYILVAGVLMLFRSKWLKAPLNNSIIKKMLK